MQEDRDSGERCDPYLPEHAAELPAMPGEQDRIAGVSSYIARPPSGLGQAPPLDAEDYYYEGEMIVFTGKYHLRRGYCCESGCRHCPF